MPKYRLDQDWQVDFGKLGGLVTVVIQDWRTNQVLQQAFMNQESWQRTLATGEIWLWSRSRQKLWHKGETSGNVMLVKELWLDCDGDCVLAKVKVLGKALVCHEDRPSCFARRLKKQSGK